MNNTTQDITIEVCGHEMDATVNVSYEPGEKAVTHLAPEDCHEGIDEVWELDTLIVDYREDDLPIPKHFDLSGLLDIRHVHDSILNDVKELMIDGG